MKKIKIVGVIPVALFALGGALTSCKKATPTTTYVGHILFHNPGGGGSVSDYETSSMPNIGNNLFYYFDTPTLIDNLGNNITNFTTTITSDNHNVMNIVPHNNKYVPLIFDKGSSNVDVYFKIDGAVVYNIHKTWTISQEELLNWDISKGNYADGILNNDGTIENLFYDDLSGDGFSTWTIEPSPSTWTKKWELNFAGELQNLTTSMGNDFIDSTWQSFLQNNIDKDNLFPYDPVINPSGWWYVDGPSGFQSKIEITMNAVVDNYHHNIGNFPDCYFAYLDCEYKGASDDQFNWDYANPLRFHLVTKGGMNYFPCPLSIIKTV